MDNSQGRHMCIIPNIITHYLKAEKFLGRKIRTFFKIIGFYFKL